MEKLNCAPNPNKTLDFTCYTPETLLKMRSLWNARHPDRKIETTNPKEIWNTLSYYMKDSCSNEMCWIRQGFTDKEIINKEDILFAPKAPDEWKTNPNEWLSSIDILNVMKQYERKYKCFEFMGPSPIDYDTHIMFGQCVWEELCHFNLKSLMNKGIFKIGIIFNLDPHYKNGSHWVSLFINIKKKGIYFFDSYGLKPHKQIKKFINKIQRQGRQQGININYAYNKKQHQFGDSECGMYSLYFIIENLKDTTNIDKLFNHRITDKEMEELRQIYFN
jgi:hypothetical protein